MVLKKKITDIRALRLRDVAILAHLALYKIAFYATLSKLFFSLKAVGHIGKKLDEELGLVCVHHRAIERLSYLTLSLQGAKVIECPKERCNVQSAALDSAIGISLYCCMGDERRHKLEHSDLEKAFAGGEGPVTLPALNVPHVVSSDRGYPAILRVYQCQTDVNSAIKQLREQFESSLANPSLTSWVLAQDYGFLCLGTTPQKVKNLRAAAERAGLHDDGLFQFGLGPDQSTVSRALKDWRGEF